MDEGARKFDLRPILRLVADGKWFLLAGALAGGLLFGVQAFLLAGPVYRATAVVILDTRSEELAAGPIVAGLSGEMTEINTEIEVLRGRALLADVVDGLGLVADPEFNTALVPDPWTVTARRAVREAILGPPPPRGEGWEREATVSALQARINVQAVPASYVFRVTASAGDPVKAARIADAVAAAYIDGQVAAKAAAVDAATAALSGRVAELEAQLAAAEARLAGMTAAQDALTPDDLVGLDRALTETREALAAVEGQIAVAPAGLTAEEVAARRAALLADEAALVAQAEAMAAAERRIDQTWREVEVTRALYEDFLTRLKETAVQRELIRPDARVLSAAVPPAVHATPRRAQTMTMGMILGLVVAGGVLLLREGMVRTLRSVAEVEAETGRRVLSALPEMPGETGRDILRGLAERPLSPEAEAVRLLRTALALEPGGPLPGVIMLTSALPGEGKTTLAAALAQNLAAVGLSVVLVETDLRRRAFAAFSARRGRRALSPSFRASLAWRRRSLPPIHGALT